ELIDIDRRVHAFELNPPPVVGVRVGEEVPGHILLPGLALILDVVQSRILAIPVAFEVLGVAAEVRVDALDESTVAGHVVKLERVGAPVRMIETSGFAPEIEMTGQIAAVLLRREHSLDTGE